MSGERNRWEELARDDPVFYISTIGGARNAYAREAFIASGSRDVEKILDEARPWLSKTGVALEIGCGVGRLTIPMAVNFREVVAVDVSPTMLGLLRENCERRGVFNVRSFLATEPWHDGLVADFVYSVHVFQHISSLDEIASHLMRIRRCLDPDGIAYLHFDTRSRSPLYSIRDVLPDEVLPRLWRKGIRRVPRSRDEISAVMAAVGLRTLREVEPGSADHIYVVQTA